MKTENLKTLMKWAEEQLAELEASMEKEEVDLDENNYAYGALTKHEKVFANAILDDVLVEAISTLASIADSVMIAGRALKEMKQDVDANKVINAVIKDILKVGEYENLVITINK